MRLEVQTTSTQRRTTPSVDVAMAGASTRKPHNSVMYQIVDPAAEPQPWRPRCSTPSAVMPAAYHSLTSVPRRRNCTESMLGSAMPRKQAGIHTTN